MNTTTTNARWAVDILAIEHEENDGTFSPGDVIARDWFDCEQDAIAHAAQEPPIACAYSVPFLDIE